MASTNWEKVKDMGEAKAKIMHNDKDMRLIHEHSNTHINKELTPYNQSYFSDMTYADKIKRLDKAFANASDGVRLSSGKNASVLVANLCVYPPDGLVDDYEQLMLWYKRVGDMAVERWGDNVIALEIHVDEIHEYTDPITKEECISKQHGHLSVVPIDIKTGKLNCKKFSARKNIKAWNNALERMTQTEFGCKYNSGKLRKDNYKSVEELKAESEKVAVELGVDKIIADIKDKQQQLEADQFVFDMGCDIKNDRLKARETSLEAREQDLKRQAENIKAKEENALRMANKAVERQKELDARETLLEAREANLEDLVEQNTIEYKKRLKTAYKDFEDKCKKAYQKAYDDKISELYNDEYILAVARQQAIKQGTSPSIVSSQIKSTLQSARQDMTWLNIPNNDNDGFGFS